MMGSKPQSFAQNPIVALSVVILSVIYFAYSFAQFRKAPSQAGSRAPLPAPASIGNADASYEPPRALGRFGTAKVAILDLGCIENANDILETEADAVRLTGRVCSRKRNGGTRAVHAHYETKNVALVGFYDSYARVLATEYFPVSEGRNLVHVELEYGKGKPMGADILVQKRAPGSAKR